MSQTPATKDLLKPNDTFARRHIGPSDQDIQAMLEVVGYSSLDELVRATVPEAILNDSPMELPDAMTESEMLARARELAEQNDVYRSFIGLGYHEAKVPAVIARNIFENPAWYTQYTPYQPEISQGRLEALLNYQTMIIDLTGMEVANASLLDEGTAAAEAMTLCYNVARGKKPVFLVSAQCHPQTIEVVKTRALPLGIEVQVVEDINNTTIAAQVCGVLVQYPTTDGSVTSYAKVVEAAHANKALVVVAADLLSLTLLEAPGTWGADVVVGNSQRFGVPLGFGGPHAAFFATYDKHKRKIPGRIVGVSKDTSGKPALRLALQAREQHIRRDKATSNICTSQVLLAVMAGMYGVYHGPEGLKDIARRVNLYTRLFAAALSELGYAINTAPVFDTVWVDVQGAARARILAQLNAEQMEVRQLDETRLSATFDEAVTFEQLETLIGVFVEDGQDAPDLEALVETLSLGFDGELGRTTAFMTHESFNQYHAEHEMLRYMYRLQQKDLSLTTSMIPLGSCTMKLNATSEMLPVTMSGFSNVHPFTDASNTAGYAQLIAQLEQWLAEITGLAAVSLQPNSGAQGEYAGLLAIRAYHEHRGQAHRNICLIPSSAHGTNPASAVMAGMKVVVVACDDLGNVDIEDLRQKAQEHAENLSALMITYPSTHGVFEQGIREICGIVHEYGGQVYMDGANMNAQVGLCRPGEFGVDVLHLNLHKTFCIPHGGGGPGVGPIAVAEHLKNSRPGHCFALESLEQVGPVSAAPWGSASILPISWMYIGMMGAQGLKRATQVAILNANYMARRLKDAYKLLYTGENGNVAHEFILDLRPIRDATGITVVDVAKRLMDYGFHAPTMSWPVEGTLMVEPTESETRAELDRLVDALLAIREEIAQIERGDADRENNVLTNAPHTADKVLTDEWPYSYSRQTAAYPASWTRVNKFWPSVGRVDDAFGDRNLQCSCPPLESYAAE